MPHHTRCLNFPKCEIDTVEMFSQGCDLVEGGRTLRLQAVHTQSRELGGKKVGGGERGEGSERGGAGGGPGRSVGRRAGLQGLRGRAPAPAMGPAVRLAALLAVLALQAGDLAGVAARGDTFSALTSVARALAPERRLLGLLRRYLRGEEARLRDLTR